MHWMIGKTRQCHHDFVYVSFSGVIQIKSSTLYEYSTNTLNEPMNSAVVTVDPFVLKLIFGSDRSSVNVNVRSSGSNLSRL